MIEKIEPWIQGKRVLLLGFGREGRSTYNVLRRLGTCSVLDVADQLALEDQPEGIETWISGPDYQSCLNDYDVVFKSPGVVLERPAEEYRCQILSQTEVFFQCFRDQIIGITGTKGKSTITTLLYHLLKHAGYDTILAGNIGIPVFDLMEDIRPETIIVCELSCHQLEYMTVSPHIAVLSNIHEEHLDHYGTMEKYVRAEEGVMLAFRQLGGYGDTLAGLNQLDDQTLWKLLRENQFTKAAQADTFTEQLARTAQRALQGEYGTDLREAFQEIVRSMLLNESVFLPLHHTIVPLEWEGRRMYSELWVDPDAEEREEARDGRGDGHKIQFLFKMDLPSVGFLEMTLGAGKEQVDVSVYGPDSVTAHSGLIAEDLGQILADHGLKGRSVQVQKHTRPLTLTEVFPGLFEGERGINVKI